MRASAVITSAALLASSVSAIPARLSAATLGENLPWKLSKIVIYENVVPENQTTQKTIQSHLRFHLSDPNPGIQFETDCTRTVKAGEELYDGQLYPCGQTQNVLWSIDSTKTIHIQHGWTDPSVGRPGQDFVTCFGSWTTSMHPFENRVPKWTGPLQGTNYTQGCMEVYCTEMTA